MNTTISRLRQDFEEQKSPFDKSTLPEQAILDNVDRGDELSVLSYGVSLDYNRSADQLWDNVMTLYDRAISLFDPALVYIKTDISMLSHIFEEIGFRYPNRDAKGWYHNSKILYENYDSSWSRLLKAANFDATELVSLLEEDGFMYLKGDKLAPFYAKVVSSNITELDNVWQLPIPVDVHIRRLTIDLVGRGMTDDEIRAYWKHEVTDPMVVDTALWLIGNQWDEWGEKYWEELT